jgi:metal transporter CNNM
MIFARLSHTSNRIIPQAVSVRYGLFVGATCAPFVLIVMYILGESLNIPPSWENSIKCSLAPVAYPIAKLLDYVLGANEAHTYKKAELKSFLQFHRTGEEPLRDDEINILNGVLELNSKNVETIMTPLKVSTAPSRLFPI